MKGGQIDRQTKKEKLKRSKTAKEGEERKKVKGKRKKTNRKEGEEARKTD